MTDRLKPPALPDKATIAVVAPASPPQTRSEAEQATAYFEDRGHTVVFGPNYRKVHGYLAGTDSERAADLQWALSEPGIDMVLALEGGYGTARLHDLVDWDAVGEPRIVCGYSDLTALHLFLATHRGWTTFYGPNFLRFTRTKGRWELTKETEDWFHRAFRPEPLGIPAIANVPCGHGKHMATMPLGATVRIDGAGKTLEVLEPAVEPRGN
jgi:muramoyltetrapeptide carboxypeptidase